MEGLLILQLTRQRFSGRERVRDRVRIQIKEEKFHQISSGRVKQLIQASEY